MDFSFVLAPGTAIVSASVAVLVNEAPPIATTDWTIGDVMINGSMVYARLTGGVESVDYQIRFTITDSDGNIFPRTALILCSQTS